MVGQCVNIFPYSGFKWLSQKEIGEFCLNSVECNLIKENSFDWYILEVDFKYHDALHELQNDYPLAPEENLKLVIIYCQTCSNIANEYGIKIVGVDKLVPNLGYKSKSNVLHYKNLQLYLSLGIKLVKVRKILKFKQSYWLILIQTKEKNAANSFEKDFLKLISNGTFGKAMENVRKRSTLDWLIMLEIIKSMQANQVLFHRKYWVNILLLFMELNQF